MFRGDPQSQIDFGTPERRCWHCVGFRQDDYWPSSAQPLAECTRVRWISPKNGHRQMVHADDVCEKFEESFGRTPGEVEAIAIGMGLG